MPQHKIMIDIDGVLADFCEAFTRTARGLYPDVPIVSTVKQPDRQLSNWMDEERVNATWREIRRQEAWWTQMHPLLTERELYRLRHLMSAYDVVFCTARKARKPGGLSVAEQTIQWLEAKGIVRPSLVVSSKKGEIARAIGATHAIDDKPENVCMTHWLTDGACESFVLDRPYNQNYAYPKEIRRVATLGEFFDAIEGPNKLDKQASEIKLSLPGEKSKHEAA